MRKWRKEPPRLKPHKTSDVRLETFLAITDGEGRVSAFSAPLTCALAALLAAVWTAA
jgi:hypothetical protein